MESYEKVMRLSCEEVDKILLNSHPGKHTNFLRSAHSLWFRFKNYEKNPPFALVVDSEIKSMIFSTFNRDGYANLYEIVTVEGESGHGYGDALWKKWIKIATNSGCSRLKISCTPNSIRWHYSHGLIFWGVDKSGSLRSDQTLFPTVEEQLAYREEVLRNPIDHLPPKSQVQKFKKEIQELNFGSIKKENIQKAIAAIGGAWLAPNLYREQQ